MPVTLTGKIWVSLASFPSLSYINFGKIVLRSGNFRSYFEDWWSFVIQHHSTSFYSDDQIKLQLLTCHNSWTVLAWMKLCPDLMIIFHVRATDIFTRFGSWAHTQFVTWVCGSHPPSIPHLVMLGAHSFPFPRDVRLNLGSYQRHAGGDEAHMGQTLLHDHRCTICVLGRITRLFWIGHTELIMTSQCCVRLKSYV